MTRLLERLDDWLHEHWLHPTPAPRPTSGFADCRGDWHFWDEE